MKLEIDLVPRTCWGKNLRKLVRESVWDKLRAKAKADAGNVCRICGAVGKLNCDEIWHYDDEEHVQKLIGLRVLCTMCHFAKHIGSAQQVAAEGHLDFNAVIEHFMKVNGVDRAAFDEHKSQAFAQWKKRSAHEWTSDFGEWSSLVKSTRT
jgi:hypothetical protein